MPNRYGVRATLKSRGNFLICEKFKIAWKMSKGRAPEQEELDTLEHLYLNVGVICDEQGHGLIFASIF
jgi:hypothetical protein